MINTFFIIESALSIHHYSENHNFIYELTEGLQFNSQDMSELMSYYKYFFPQDFINQLPEKISIAVAVDNILKSERNNYKRSYIHNIYTQNANITHSSTLNYLTKRLKKESEKKNNNIQHKYEDIRKIFDLKCAEAILYYFENDQTDIVSKLSTKINQYKEHHNIQENIPTTYKEIKANFFKNLLN